MNLNEQDPRQRGTVHRLAGFDMTLAYDDFPVPGFPLAPRITRATNALLAVDAKIAAIKQDQHLSEAGRAAKLKALDAEVVPIANDIAKIEATADDLNLLLDAQVEAVLEVPPLDPANSVGYSYDRERRDFVAGLSGDQRSRFMQELQEGKHPEIALALARSPLPTPERQIGLAMFRASLSKENEQELCKLESERAALKWTRSATGAMRHALAKRNARKVTLKI